MKKRSEVFTKRCTEYTAVTVKDLKDILDKHEDWEMLICREGELDIMSSEIRDFLLGPGATIPACKWLGRKAKIAIRKTGVSITEMWASKKNCEKAKKDFQETKVAYDAFRQKINGSSQQNMEKMMGMVFESIETEWREFSYIASELQRRRIEAIIDKDRRDIQLLDETTGKAIVFGSLPEVKAFALGLDWGVKNAENLAFCGLHSSICKDSWK